MPNLPVATYEKLYNCLGFPAYARDCQLQVKQKPCNQAKSSSILVYAPVLTCDYRCWIMNEEVRNNMAEVACLLRIGGLTYVG